VRKPKPAGVLILAVVALVLAACTSGGGSKSAKSSLGAVTSSGAANPSTSSGASATAPPKPSQIVHVTSLENDGTTWGIGMPIVLYFTPVPKTSRAFTAAAKVTVNGQPANGAWYWEQPTAYDVQHHIIEAHYRPQNYWPANSRIHVALPIGGLSAGGNLVYSNKLTSLDFSIGDSHISYVDGQTLLMRVTDNGKLVRRMPTSLGTPDAPTYNGVKVVMQKGEDIPGTGRLRPNGTVLMSSDSGGYHNIPVQWSVRVTQSGEYVHSAPWNSRIGAASTSHGCTNLHAVDGKWFYNFSNVGDVVVYQNTDGGRMPSWDGLGDWNVPWGQWQQGGLLLNH
jgi:lipoprotein-anchoring transpeptidase ErfK/SrfK